MSDEVKDGTDLRAAAEGIVDERFRLLGGGTLTSDDMRQLQVTNEEMQAIHNAFIQGRDRIGGPYPSSEELDAVLREFNVAKAYAFLLRRFIMKGDYLVNVNEQGTVEILPGDDAARKAAAWALKIARETTTWKPRWEVQAQMEVTVLADTPEEALEKARKGFGDLSIESGKHIEGLAFNRPDEKTLRLDRMPGLSSDDEHADKWQQVEAKYPQYIKPPVAGKHSQDEFQEGSGSRSSD